MTREEAIEILRDTPIAINSSREDDIHTLYAMAQNMAIEALEQEPMRGKWIPVTESLPEEGLTVLIFTESGDIEFGQRDENKWEWLAESIADYWTASDYVIAWQPLPEPYEGAE